jgi:hypothetical protein
MPTRRHVLEVLAAAPFAAGCSTGPDPAAAWRNPGAGETDPRRHALAHAILAPNPHNMQPWLIDLVGDSEIVLFTDRTRLLPITDPPNRQVTVGCGAFLELLDLAARENGHRADIVAFPDGEPQPVLDERPVARIVLAQDDAVGRDPLFGAILQRRSNRRPFDLRRVPATDDLRAVVDGAIPRDAGPPLRFAFANDTPTAGKLRDIVWRGWVREMQTPAALKESVDVMRIGAAEIAQHRDGLTLDGPMIEVARTLGMLKREQLLDPDSDASRQGRAMWKKLADSSPAFVWIAGADNTRATQVAAGRAYARLNLAAQARGLQMHPWSMALQEYPEMADLYAEQQAMLGATAAAPAQMLARIGYAKPVKPAPRRGLAAHLRA